MRLFVFYGYQIISNPCFLLEEYFEGKGMQACVYDSM